MANAYESFDDFEEEFLQEFEQAKINAEIYGAGILMVSADGQIVCKSFGEVVDYVIDYLNTTKQLNS